MVNGIVSMERFAFGLIAIDRDHWDSRSFLLKISVFDR